MRNIEYGTAELVLLCEEYEKAAAAGRTHKLDGLRTEIRARIAELEGSTTTSHGDSAFFAGELNANMGEKEAVYPEYVEDYRERRDRRMLQRRIDAEEEERKGGHGNTRIPFGLCKREGISVQNGWTPRDAWSALAGKGYDVGSVYRELRQTGKVAPRSAAFQYKRPDAQDRTIGRIAKKTAELKREQYRIVNADGAVVLENRGDKHSVAATVGEKREHLRGNVSIHNHPDGGTFSPDDLSDFGYGAKEMVVSGPDGIYSLVNAKYGTKEQFSGWLDMREALEKACPETSGIKLLQQARKNLEHCEERERMSAISAEFVRRKDAGESVDDLRTWINGSGYDELEARYKKKLAAEQRRLEVEPFHRFYRENAGKYGFLYRFTPRGGSPIRSAVERMRSEPDAPTMEDDMKAQGYAKNAEGHWAKKADSADTDREDAIKRYRQRRAKRLSRMDEEGRWVTTENDHKVHINEEGVPDKGNPHVLATMRGEGKNPKTAEEVGKARIGRKAKLIKELAGRTEDRATAHEKAVDDRMHAERELKKAERGLGRVGRYKELISGLGYGEGDKAKMEREAEKLQLQMDKLKNNRPITALSDEEKAKLSEMEARKNQLEYGAAVYDDCYGPDAFTEKRAEEARKKLDDADRIMRKAEADYLSEKKELRRVAKDGDIDRAKLFTRNEREAIVKEVLSSECFEAMTEQQRRVTMEAIEKASDAELSVLKKTFSKARIIDGKGRVSSSGADSFYSRGTGAITLSQEDMGEPRVVWHEFGHFLDDPECSDCPCGSIRIMGSTYKNSMSQALDETKVLHGDRAAADLQALVERKYPGRFRFESADGNMIRVWDNERGDYVDGDTDDSISFCMSEVTCERFRDFIYRDEEYEAFMKSIDCPREEDRPKWEDYFEYYTTPKRKIERHREKRKGATTEYNRAVEEYYSKRDRAIGDHHEAFVSMTDAYSERCKQRESELSAVSDILCGMMYGEGIWIYGGHSKKYYHSDARNPAKEAVANFHQLRVMRCKYGLELLKSMVPSVYNGLEEMYNEWLWRNVDL